MRILLTLLLVLFGSLQYRLWYGSNNLPDNWKLQEKIEQQLAGNAQLEQRNELLQREIEDLGSGLEAVEERARNELGMIKENEQFFRVISRSPKS
ncbi:cell division protein FtsB [Ferrimonas lipolytica]|uniref:Cell division protein FtsB n=1 Tax=Ferrimonas lipolytica TaxID=2724191 RepID=A0A6H1UAF1_9GAMM|nr:cell division protein FtsB [Ferrimonas lipolytica]QIZ75560.1 cell division protein FtsB [Ferrimonas lipolytica]